MTGMKKGSGVFDIDMTQFCPIHLSGLTHDFFSATRLPSSQAAAKVSCIATERLGSEHGD